MKVSPLFLSAMYFLMGLTFAFIALKSAENTVWNIATIFFTLIASFDFGVAIQILFRHRRAIKHKKE